MHIAGEIPKELGDLGAMQLLYISSNRLTGTFRVNLVLPHIAPSLYQFDILVITIMKQDRCLGLVCTWDMGRPLCLKDGEAGTRKYAQRNSSSIGHHEVMMSYYIKSATTG